jgi:hypothetical protein
MANSAALGAATGLRASTGFRARTLRGLLLRGRTRLQRAWLDRAIARGVERPDDDALALRQAQLAAPRERERLALRLEEILAARPRPVALSSAAPVDHAAVEVAKPLLSEVILSLRSSDGVEPRGVVLGWRLLTDATSPLYGTPRGRHGDPDGLWYEALALLFALRPLPDATARTRAVRQRSA